jgi:2'-5' RNA ligase
VKKYNAFVYCTFPAEIESAFPRFGRILNDDFTRPHVSVVYMPGLTASEVGRVAAAIEMLSKRLQPFEVDFGSVKSFPPRDKSSPWYVQIDGRGIIRLREAVLSIIDSLGIELNEKFDEFVPHATLQYLEEGRDYDGKSPSGSCMISEVHFAFKEAE